MGAGCISTPAPINEPDTEYSKKKNPMHFPEGIVQCTQDNEESPCLNSSHNTFVPKQPQHKKRRRKSVRKRTFDSDRILPRSDSNISSKSKSIFIPTTEFSCSNRDSLHTSNLPIRFAKDHEIWTKEYNLFIQNISNLLPLNTTDKYATIGIIEMVLEYGGIDVMYTYGYAYGLWPQHYIYDELAVNGMIMHDIRDELIHSFNLGGIFEICGNRYAAQSNIKTNRFFAYSVDVIEANEGYRSATPSIAYNTVNPLKFKIYCHDIMVLHKGFYIERHNEYFYAEDGIDQVESDPDPTYFMTLILLPPNIQSYRGGSFKFYTKGENNYIYVAADRYCWSWILFDKRIEYECDPIVYGKCIVFKMDIDVWRKSTKEIKQNEESYDTINKLLTGELKLKHNMEYADNDVSMSVISPSVASPSVNVIFPPCSMTFPL